MNLYFPKDWGASRGLWSLSTPFTQLHAFGTSNEVCTFQKTPDSHYCWGPPLVLSTRLVFLLCKHATVSILYNTRKRAPGHRAPWCQPDPSHQGAPGGGVPTAGDTLNLLLHLPQVLTSQTHHLAPSYPTRLIGASSGLHQSWHPFLGYPQMMRGPPLSEGYMPLLAERARGLVYPPTVPLWWEATWWTLLWVYLQVPHGVMSPGVFSLMSWGLGSPMSVTTRALAVTRVVAAARASPADGVTHPFHLLF